MGNQKKFWGTIYSGITIVVVGATLIGLGTILMNSFAQADDIKDNKQFIYHHRGDYTELKGLVIKVITNQEHFIEQQKRIIRRLDLP